MTENAAYTELEGRFARMSDVSGALAVLHWDQATMMPEGGAQARADQLAALSVIRHEMITAGDMSDLLDEADQATGGLNDWQRANLYEMRREHTHASAVPSSLVAKRSKASSACEMAWRTAKPENDFAALAPKLEELLDLVREGADALGTTLDCAPYDALLDQFDPGRTSADIDVLFRELEAFLPGFLDEVIDRQAGEPAPIRPEGPFAVADQERLARRIMQAIGFDFAGGRLDVSLHPFSGGVPQDSRITTRFDENDFTSSLMAVIHETGHSQYERHRPPDWLKQPVGRARGMAVHESQSLLYEMQAARSPEFIGYLAPVLRETFSGSGDAWQTGNLVRLYHKVARSAIRVDADEVSYPLHIILRYRLERDLIAGHLKICDVPEAWNEGMRALVGIVPDTDREGCLQDIHWPIGAFGYFPSYTLGALGAAQIFSAACDEDPGILNALASGDFMPLNTWLAANIHGAGSRYSSHELMQRVTGAPLSVSAFRTHLQRRYLGAE